MQFKHVTLDFDGSVAILRLDHQEVMNAVSVDMLGGLAQALDTIEEKKDEVRCVVLTGAGRAFCTGANLQGRNNQAKKTKAGMTLETAFYLPAPHPQSALPDRHCRQRPGRPRRMSFALLGDMILCARSSYFLQRSAASAWCRIAARPGCCRA